MKKISLLLVLVLVFSCFVACTGETGIQSATPTPTAVVTPTPEPSPEPTPKGTKFVFEGITLYLPDGYTTQYNNNIPIIYSDRYPEVADNITLTKTVADSINNQQKTTFESAYSQIFDSFSGITTFEKSTFKGFDMLTIAYSFVSSSIPMNQTQYLLFLEDETIIITLTDASGELTQEFNSIVQSITIN